MMGGKGALMGSEMGGALLFQNEGARLDGVMKYYNVLYWLSKSK